MTKSPASMPSSRNEQFVSRAPEDVLAEQREKRAEALLLKTRLSEALKFIAG